ncbi:MAG: rhomboid family intramembrane serine protease [Hyphomicrobiales bacterium]|nr:MAG: rhomboid family intramembrane serine protease [Hyphomicrobiales bacterium]
MPHSPETPAFNAPRVVMVLLGLLLAIHIIRIMLPAQWDLYILLTFSFIPARYGGEADILLPGGAAAGVWSVVTYALLHGNFVHLIVNGVWMLAFASPLAARLDLANFLGFTLVCSVAGVVAHLAFHWGEAIPVVGASAAISGYMAAAMRFVFQSEGPLGAIGGNADNVGRMHALPIRETLRDRRVLAFLAVWIGINILMGLGALQLDDELSNIAWEAHIAGLLAGLFLFDLFDRPQSVAGS